MPTQRADFFTANSKGRLFRCQLKGQTVSTASTKDRFCSLPTQRADFVHCQLKGQTLFKPDNQIFLQHGKRFQPILRSQGKPILRSQGKRFQPSLFFLQHGKRFQLKGLSHPRTKSKRFQPSLFLLQHWQTISTMANGFNHQCGKRFQPRANDFNQASSFFAATAESRLQLNFFLLIKFSFSRLQ